MGLAINTALFPLLVPVHAWSHYALCLGRNTTEFLISRLVGPGTVLHADAFPP